MSSRPVNDLLRVRDAQARLVAVVGSLDENGARRASLLPGWSVGHVLTHLARNADSQLHRIRGALRGEVVDQYPGGYEGRAADIEAGAGRPANELVEDVRSTGEALDEEWAVVPDEAWSAVSRDVGGTERPLSSLPLRRWQELEVHLIDLDVGPTYRDWPDDFVSAWLPRLRASVPERLPFGREAPAPGLLEPHEELAWLYGRLVRDDLPALAGWG